MSNHGSNNSSMQWKFSDFIEHDEASTLVDYPKLGTPTNSSIEPVNQSNLADVVNAIKEGGRITDDNFNLLDYIATNVFILAILKYFLLIFDR